MFNLMIACHIHIESVIRDHILFSTFIRTSVTPKLLKLALMHPTLVASDVKTPSARLLSYGKSTTDCHLGIMVISLLTAWVFAQALLEY